MSSMVDHLALARSSIAAASQNVTGRVRAIHIAVAKSSIAKARTELESIEILLRAHEAQLAIDGVGDR